MQLPVVRLGLAHGELPPTSRFPQIDHSDAGNSLSGNGKCGINYACLEPRKRLGIGAIELLDVFFSSSSAGR